MQNLYHATTHTRDTTRASAIPRFVGTIKSLRITNIIKQWQASDKTTKEEIRVLVANHNALTPEVATLLNMQKDYF